MPKYLYTATTRDGKVENGSIDARDTGDAAEQLRRAGLLVVTMRRETSRIVELITGIGFVPNVIKVTFSKHLSLMIKAGLSIDESVRVLRDQAANRFRRVLSGVLRTVESGRPLSEAFAEYPGVFSELFIATIRAGEASGTLERSLDDLADQLTKSFELQRKIRGAMIYPVLVLSAALAIGLGLSYYVLPKVIGLFESISVDLPFTTRVLLGFSNFLLAHGTLFFVGLIVFIVGFIQFIGWTPIRPYSHWVLLKLPIFGKLAQNYNLAFFARTMSTLLRSGISIGDAFQVSSNTIRNALYKKALLRVRQGTETGIPASTVLEEFPKLFPSISTRMLAVGEHTGKLEETFGYLSSFYEDEVDNTTKNLSTILEPVLLILIGLAVAFIAISIIAPIYNFIGNIERL
jgi:type IV pilus assembly protein PilC